jgi:hypothetical protein
LNKNQFTEWKKLYSLIFAKFLKIKNQKSAILDCKNGLLQKFSTTKRGELFEKFLCLSFRGKKQGFFDPH